MPMFNQESGEGFGDACHPKNNQANEIFFFAHIRNLNLAFIIIQNFRRAAGGKNIASPAINDQLIRLFDFDLH